MPQPNATQELITLHRQRLHELEKQQAIAGLSADPRIPIEIKHIEAEIRRLQAELDKTNTPAPAVSTSPLAPTGQAILVVEDDPIWQEILREYLSDMACRVEIAATLAEARQKLQTGQYSLVTLDAHLNRAEEGMLLLDYIRNRLGPNFPILIVSGEISKRDLVRAFQKFLVAGVLLKENFEYDEFRLAVQQALQEQEDV